MTELSMWDMTLSMAFLGFCIAVVIGGLWSIVDSYRWEFHRWAGMGIGAMIAGSGALLLKMWLDQ
jgi:ABC-type arginine transport system permease subunit